MGDVIMNLDQFNQYMNKQFDEVIDKLCPKNKNSNNENSNNDHNNSNNAN